MQMKGESRYQTDCKKQKKMVQYLTHFQFSQYSGIHFNFIEFTHER